MVRILSDVTITLPSPLAITPIYLIYKDLVRKVTDDGKKGRFYLPRGSILLYSLFIINAGLMRTALRTCQSNVPREISKVRIKPVTKIPAPIGAFTAKSLV